MRGDELFRMVLFGILAGGIAWETYSRFDADFGEEREGAVTRGPRYAPLIPGSLLPTSLLGVGVLAVCLAGFDWGMRLMLPMLFSVFLQITLYYALLLPVLPFLRKKISARTCAMLWLLPSYLYYIFYSSMELSEPRWVIHLPGKMIWILLGIWFAGFAAVMVWKITEHLAFRCSIL